MSYSTVRKIRNLSLTILLFLVVNCANAMQQKDVVSQADEEALFQAAYTGDVATVENLLAKGVDSNTQDDDGNTALILASTYGHLAIVETLLASAGIDINHQSKGGHAALMMAAFKGHEAIVEKLLTVAGIGLNAQDKNGNTALILAAVKGYENIVERLIAAVGIDLNAQDKNGDTALMAAVFNGHEAIVEKLATSAGIDLSRQNELDYTALTLAAHINDIKSVNLLLDAYEADKNRKIPQKSCFLTFTQNVNPLKVDYDFNGTVMQGLLNALANKIVVVCNPSLLNNIINEFVKIKHFFRSKKWSLFLNQTHDFCVIIPEQIESVEQLHEKYGFINLDYIKPEDAVQSTAVTYVQDDQFDKCIQHFKEIIDVHSSKHPTRFYLDGHGSEEYGGVIAGIRTKYVAQLLTIFADIDAQFVYINSCYTAGKNMLDIQKYIQAIFEKQLKENLHKQIVYDKSKYPWKSHVYDSENYRGPKKKLALPERIKSINYAIVLMATSDVPTSGSGDLNTFFERLDKFLDHAQKRMSINNIFQPLGKSVFALPSIRFPGTTTFFRSVDLGEMEIITWAKLQALRLEKLLDSRKIIRALQNELSEIREKEPLMEMKEAADKEQQLSKRIKEENAKLSKLQQIEIPLKQGIKYVQIFPCNLSDCTFVIQGNNVPKFISKIPGQAHHFIGKITYASQKDDFDEAFDDFRENAFINIFEGENALTTKCWFIKSLELVVGGVVYTIDHVVIYVDPEEGTRVLYHDSTGYNYRSPKSGDRKISPKAFKLTIQDWFKYSAISDDALYEATGGNEGKESAKEALNKFLD